MNNVNDMITTKTPKLVSNEQSQFNDNHEQEVINKKQTVENTSTNTNEKKQTMITVQQLKRQYSEVEHSNHDTTSRSKQITKTENYMEKNVKTIILSEQHENHTTSFEIQVKKSPVTILNDWSRHVNKFRRESNTCKVTYMLVNIGGYAHKPVFTYRCQIYDITAEGSGYSKKEAKRNSATQLLTKLSTMDTKINISDAITIPTTIGNNNSNIEVIENKSENEISGRPLIIDDSDKSNKELKLLNDDAIKVALFNLSPIAALHDLVREYKWRPPIYQLRKIVRQFHKGLNRTQFEITCKLVHLQTKGISNTKQKAKRISASLMFHKVRNLDTELLNIINQRPTVISNKKDKQTQYEDFQTSRIEWASIHHFHSFFTTAVKKSFENINDVQILQDQKTTFDQYKEQLEQYIINNDPELNDVDKLEIICQKLGTEATYVVVHNATDLQQDNEHNKPDKECAVLLQVTIIPITVNIEYASSVELAAEKAAKNVLQMLKIMLIHSLQYSNVANC